MIEGRTIVLSTGGTGGHLYPAQALAAELARRGAKIVVMTDARGTQYPSYFPGAAIEVVPAATFSGRSALRLAAAPLQIVAGIVTALRKLSRLRPSAVVGFGGYPSLPVMVAACVARRPTAIVAPDAVVGRANRIVANHVKVIAGGLPLRRFLPRDMSKVVYTGTPVRPEVVASSHVPYQAPQPDGGLRLLVFGGSQGAHAMSEIVPAAIGQLPQDMRVRLEIVQQCRPEDIAEVRAAYGHLKVKAELASFFPDLPERMARAHLVIGRSGAGTVTELMVIGRPAILIPLPHALDDNQTPNADVFVEAGAGWKTAQAALTPEKLAGMLAEAFSDPADLSRRAALARQHAKPDAANRLADVVEKLALAA
ncbi:MAG: undecaprenyldiphospho-muramoylpentapeptide beta-N-acetylglucosaminyltransferase [Alphaproteobacteria bacterium]|nr:undecaprenyldiphospho-muramoylpentapeptide beta-N-acetylglucosaminyltransferase [Alphaproteobacteria bacterium]